MFTEDTIKELTIYECGICDCYHPWSWNGDCRDEANRFFPDDYAEFMEIDEFQLEIRDMDDRVLADLGVQWYQEIETGDYLVVSLQEIPYMLDCLEGRSTAIAGMPESMNTGSISKAYLEENCVSVAEDDVPSEWQKWGWLY